MLRIWIAIVWLAVVGVPSAKASQLVLKDANTIVAVCETKDPHLQDAFWLRNTDCITYLIAVTEVYFLSNPTCPKPDGLILADVLANLILSTRAMSQQQLASDTAVNVVYQAIAKAHPCPIAEKSNVPNPELCRAGFAVLNNAWSDQMQKQAALEILRNKGCLN